MRINLRNVHSVINNAREIFYIYFSKGKFIMTYIYYFTRTGGCEKAAHEISEQTKGTICKISDNKNWNGILGFIKGAYYASGKKSLKAQYEKPTAGENTIYLCFPVWAGTFPPAVRSLINEIGRENIIAVPKSKGSGLSDKAGFIKVIELIGKDAELKI